MAHSVSPLAPTVFPDLPEISGVRFSTAQAGIKYRHRTDVMLALLDSGTSLVGCYTRSKTRSAPVEWCAEHTPCSNARAVIVNSGNSNAFTGKKGVQAVLDVTHSLATQIGCPPESVFMASTGVIGEPLKSQKIISVLPNLISEAKPHLWHEAARAIMTTDTFPKLATICVDVLGTSITINGFAKGSGMIAPDMATMLAFLFTDAEIPPSILHTLLSRAVTNTFNNTTVDGDTSTSDTVLCAATGKTPLGLSENESPDPMVLEALYQGLEHVCRDLAQQVIRDGEGASKFINITVRGAENNEAARKIGLSIANSPLVKTAIAGEDANWGRIVMAVGKSGEKAERDRLSIQMGGLYVAQDGMRVDDLDEARVTDHLKGKDISIEVDVGIADGTAQVWTCDLTHGYIEINGSYRS